MVVGDGDDAVRTWVEVVFGIISICCDTGCELSRDCGGGWGLVSITMESRMTVAGIALCV